MNKFLVYIVINLFFITSSAQNSNEIDSLISKATYFHKIDLDSASYYANKAYNNSLKTNDYNIIANAGYHKSVYLILQKKFVEASDVLFENLKNKSALESKTLGGIYYNLGSIYYLTEERDKSIENYLLSISHYGESENKRGLAKASLQLGVIYEKLNKENIANYFYDNSLAISSSLKKSNHKADTTHINPSIENRIKMSQEMLSEINTSKSPILTAIIYYDLAMAFFDNKQYGEAIKSSEKSLYFKQKIKFLENVDVNYAIIGKSYFNLKDYKNALFYLTKAKNISLKRHLKNELSSLIIDTYRQSGNYKKAFEMQTELFKVKDSVSSLKENEEIARITAQFETEKQAKEILLLQQENKEKELILLKQENKIWRWLIIASSLMIVIFLLGKRYLSTIKKVKQVEIEKDVIAKKVEKKHILLKNKTKIYLKELKYIKSDGNYLEFFTQSRKITDRNTLKYILEQLPPNFIKIHRSYIVNKNFISSVNSISLIVKPNVEIPLSRTFKANL